MTYSISSFPHLLLLAESITLLDEKMELTGSELAQCPAPVPTHPGQREVPFLLWKAHPLLRPGSDTHLQVPSFCSSFTSPAALEGSTLCPFPSSSHALLLPWAPLISSLSLQSVRLSICLHLFASHLHLSLLSASITSQKCSHRAHQWPQQPNPTGDFQA